MWEYVPVPFYVLEPPVKPTKPAKPAKTQNKAKPSKPGYRTLFDLEGAEAGSKKGNGHVVPTSPVATVLVVESSECVDVPRAIEAAIKNEDIRTLSDRATRYLQVREIAHATDSTFATPMVECAKLFRDGHYLGCLVLTKAVLEAVVRPIWQTKLKKKPTQGGEFNKNLDALHKKKVISDDWKARLDHLSIELNSSHLICSEFQADRQKLENLARDMLMLLHDLEREFIGFTATAATVVLERNRVLDSQGKACGQK